MRGRVVQLISDAKARGAGEAAAQALKAKSARATALRPSLGALKAARGGASAVRESVASDESRSLAIGIAIAALEKKAVGLEILDVAGRVDYADFLVVMTGRSDRQVNALAQGIEFTLKQQGKRPMAVEGLPHASWVIMDYGDVVVHVFQEETRKLYDIEGLWTDARRVPLPRDAARGAEM